MKGTFSKTVFLCFLIIFLCVVWYSMVLRTIEYQGQKFRDFEEIQKSKEFKTGENSLEKYELKKLAKRSVNVDVYYESLSSDSYVFVKEQLKNLVDRLQSRLAVKFIPFGKSNFLKKGKSTVFYCHHGPKECQGNKYHACVLTRCKNQTQQTNMVLCMLEKGFVHSMETAAELCCASFGVDFLDVRACAASQEGTTLLAEHAESTRTVDVFSVPTIAVDGAVGPKAFQRAAKNLKGVICDALAKKGAIVSDLFCRKPAGIFYL